MRGKHPIGAVIARLLSGMGATDILPYAAIRSSWTAIVGPEMERVCRPESLSGGTLTVIVAHPTWVQHLVFLKETLLANVRREVPGATVDAVVFRVGRMRQKEGVASRRREPRPLTVEEERAVEEAVARIDDPDLRRSLAEALRGALAADPDGPTAGGSGSSRS